MATGGCQLAADTIEREYLCETNSHLIDLEYKLKSNNISLIKFISTSTIFLGLLGFVIARAINN